jgi:hypothetical protein
MRGLIGIAGLVADSMRLLLTCCFLFVGESAVFASDPDHSASRFREKCDEMTRSSFGLNAKGEAEKYYAGSSAGYCLGTLKAVMALGPYLASGLKFCPGEDERPIMGIGACPST